MTIPQHAIALTNNLASTPVAGQPIPPIRTAAIAEQKYITASLVLAFSSDPVARWMYPDSYQYLAHFPHFVQTFSSKALAQATAYCIDGYAGAALWFPPGVEPDTASLFELLQRSIFESEQADVFAIQEQMARYHPQQPHWTLPMMGVEPAQQGKGYDSALMQPVLMQCDRDRIPVYLGTAKLANVLFYERHGFKVLDTVQIGASPPIFPMLRQPQ